MIPKRVHTLWGYVSWRSINLTLLIVDEDDISFAPNIQLLARTSCQIQVDKTREIWILCGVTIVKQDIEDEISIDTLSYPNYPNRSGVWCKISHHTTTVSEFCKTKIWFQIDDSY